MLCLVSIPYYYFSPSIPSESFFLPLVSSHSFPPSYNILIFFPTLSIGQVWRGFYGYCCSSSTVFLFVHYFLISDLISYSPLSYSILLSSRLCFFEFGILFFPFLTLDSIPYSHYFSSHYFLKIIFSYCTHPIFSSLFHVIFSFSYHLY